MKKFAPLAASLALMLVACGGNDPAVTKKSDTTTTTSTTAKSKAKDGKAVRTYFEAFATQDPEKMRSGMLPVSAPGSAAALYATQQAATAEAAATGGTPLPSESVKFSDDKVTACSKNPLSNEEECSDFTNFVVSDDGLLSDFDSSGNTVSSRLGKSDNSETVAMGATVKFVSAYKTGQSGNLNIVLEVTAGQSEATVRGYRAEYVGADGKQFDEIAATLGPYELKPGAKSYYVISFAGADLGGTVSVDISNANLDFAPATFPIAPAF